MTQQELEILFTDEVEAKKFWMAKRIEAGICCSNCNSKELRWDSSHNSWVCRDCNKSFTIRSGTVMQDSNLPIRVWLKAMHLMTLTKKGISALEMQRQLGLKRYEPVLYMVQKLRVAMGERDNKYELRGDVELDDAFITVVTPGRKKKVKGVRGRGSEAKQSILVMVSRNNAVSKKGKKHSNPGYIKLLVMEDMSEPEVVTGFFESVKPADTTIISDGYSSFSKLKQVVKKHKPKVTPPKQAHIHLPWVHCAIGNLKRILNGIHHHVNKENLQLYLNEFAYKFIRRRVPFIFGNLVKASVNMAWR